MAILAKKQLPKTKKHQVFSWRMPILAYTLNKMLRKFSTWFFLVIAITAPILVMLGFSLISAVLNVGIQQKMEYIRLVNTITVQITGILINFLFFFCYFKASQVFRDEITDGTLLIFNTLPMSRTRLVWEKILAYQIIIISFILLTTLLPILAVPILFRVELSAFMVPFAKNMVILAGVLILIQFLISATGLLFSLIVSSRTLGALAVSFISFFYLMGMSEGLIGTFSYGPRGSNLYLKQKEWDFKVKTNPEFQDFLLMDEEKFNASGFADWKQAVNNEYIKLLGQNNAHQLSNIWDSSEVSINAVTLKQSVDSVVNNNLYTLDFKVMFKKILQQKIYFNSNKLDENIAYEFDKDVIRWRQLLHSVSVSQSYVNSTRIITVLTYFNVFKHWNMLMPNSGAGQLSLLDNTPINSNLGFRKEDDVNRFAPNKTSQIINIPAAYVFYILLTIGAVAATWYVFKKKDFV